MLKPHFLKASALAAAVAFFGGSSPDQVATR
jgi:hypothetical protein